MQWTDDAIVLGTRSYGESSVILETCCHLHGRRSGLVRGGRSRRMRAVLQPGNLVRVTWRGRLEEQLGSFTAEPLRMHAGRVIADPLALSGLAVVVADLHLLPERDPHPALHDGALLVLERLDDAGIWPALLARFELKLLEDAGYGLDLSRCAATGATENLSWVSPKTGRAVSREAGMPYADRLFRLPRFLRDPASPPASTGEVHDALVLTGHFIRTRLAGDAGRMPAAAERRRILEALSAAGGSLGEKSG